MSKMNIDITASVKPEHPVLDRDPPFTRVVGNFDSLDYLRFVTITGVSVTVATSPGLMPGIRGPSMVTGGIIGLMGGFMYAYQNSAGQIMGFFPNDGEVARYEKCTIFWVFRQVFKFFVVLFIFPWCFVLIVCFNGDDDDDNNSQTRVASPCIEKTPKNCYFQDPFDFGFMV